MTSWQELGSVPPRELAAARNTLHHAAQLPGMAFGGCLVPARDDFSHTSLGWDHEAALWLSDPIPGTNNLHAGLRPADLALTLGLGIDPAVDVLPLPGQSLADALNWLRERPSAHGVDASEIKLELSYEDEMPSHPVADGVAFADVDPAARRELAAWFGNAALLLAGVTARHEGAAAPRTWPHHFDIGTLFPVGPPENRESQTIGAGMTPGDSVGGYDEPYIYVNAWPMPDELPELPELPAGSWNTEGWLGAVLTGSELLDGTSGDAAAQEARAREFIDAAIAGARELLS